MIKMIILTLAVTFAALGVCDFLHTLMSLLMFPDVKTPGCHVIFLKHGHALSQLRFFSFKLRWYGSEFCDEIIALADDLQKTEIAACEKFCYGGNIHICTLNEIGLKLNYYKIGETDERELD